MVSDILFDAIEEIRTYWPERLAEPEVAAVVALMDETRAWMDCNWGQDGFPATLAEWLDAPAERHMRGLVKPVGTVREVLAEMRANPDAYERVAPRKKKN